MNRTHQWALITFVSAAAGCSGGGVEGFPAAKPAAQQPAAPASQSGCGGSVVWAPVPALDCSSLPVAAPGSGIDALPGGYWTGQFLDETQAVQGYITAMVSEDGRFDLKAYRFNEHDFCTNWDAAFVGKIDVTGNALTGNGRLIGVSPTLVDGTGASDLEIDGALVERSSMSAHWRAMSGDAGCLVLNSYDRLSYEAPSALANVAGNWSIGGNVQDAFTVAADGAITGSDSNGCEFSGYLGLIDDNYSLYEVAIDVASCASAGQYKGLAWEGAGWDPGESWLLIRGNDGNRILWLNLTNRPGQG